MHVSNERVLLICSCQANIRKDRKKFPAQPTKSREMKIALLLDASGIIEFHNFDARYHHKFIPYIVDFTLGKSNIVVHVRLYGEHLILCKSCKLAGPVSLTSILKTVDRQFLKVSMI